MGLWHKALQKQVWKGFMGSWTWQDGPFWYQLEPWLLATWGTGSLSGSTLTPLFNPLRSLLGSLVSSVACHWKINSIFMLISTRPSAFSCSYLVVSRLVSPGPMIRFWDVVGHVCDQLQSDNVYQIDGVGFGCHTKIR